MILSKSASITKMIYPIVRNSQSFLHEYNLLLRTPIIRFKSNSSNLVKSSSRADLDTNVKPLGEKVRETTKTASYLAIILLGVGVTGTLFYAIFRELFSSQSPNNIYTKAVEKCIADYRISDKLGTPIKSYGEQTRRGRRQHVRHTLYEKDGRQYMRMRFYLQGTAHKGTVNLEMVENDAGKFDYRYIYIEIEDMLRTTIVLEDNRFAQSSNTLTIPTELFS